MIYQLETHIADILKEFFDSFDFIDKVVLFGSRAKHTANPKSDIDLCLYSLEMSDEQFSKLRFELDELPILYKLDIVHFEKVNRELQDNVEKDGKLLFIKTVKLEDVTLNTGQYGSNSKAIEYSSEKPRYLRITDIDNNGNLSNKKVSPSKVEEKYFLNENDFLFARSGSVGRTYLHKKHDENLQYAGYLIRYILDLKKVFPKYLFYFTKSKIYYNWIESNSNKVAQTNINAKQFLSITFPLPTLTKQKKIAKVLDRANELITLRKESIEKLDNLSKSIFIDMFGDPVLNQKGWETIKLSKLGNCKNGLNYDSKENKYKIKCLGVGDFKNLTTIYDIETLQTITVDKQPAVDYLLQNKDLVFVRSNGNKKLVGRCIEVYPNEEKVTFSGFCIRFRLSSDLVKVSYLLNVLKCKSMRQKMSGRGANIQNLNQQILNGLDIPLPPITFQNKFSTIIEKIEEQKALYEQQLKLLEDNFNSLLQRSFN